MTDEELKALVASLAVSQAKNEKVIAETWALIKENREQQKLTDEQLKSTIQQQKLTDEQLKSTIEQQKLTDEQMKRTDEQMKRTDAKLERMGIFLGNMGENHGLTTEDYFYNSLYENPVLGGIKYDSISKSIHSKTKRLEGEYDLVMYNGDSIALIECKYKAHENDVRRLINKKVESFRLLFPDFKDFAIYLGIASFSFYPELEDFARENGVAILKQKGEVVQIEADKLKAY